MNKRIKSQLANTLFEFKMDFPIETIDSAVFFKYYRSDVPIKENEDQFLFRIWDRLDLNDRFDRVKVLNGQMYFLLDRSDRIRILKAQYNLADDKLKFCYFTKGLILNFYDTHSKNKKINLNIRNKLDPCISLIDLYIKKFEQDDRPPTNDITEEDDSNLYFLSKNSPNSNSYQAPPITYIKEKFPKKKLTQFQIKFILLMDFFGKGTSAEKKNGRKKLGYFEYNNEQLKKWLCQIDIFNSLELHNINDKISKSRSVETEKDYIINDPFPTYLQEALIRYFNED